MAHFKPFINEVAAFLQEPNDRKRLVRIHLFELADGNSFGEVSLKELMEPDNGIVLLLLGLALPLMLQRIIARL